MTHFDFVRPSGVWPPECVPNAADYQRLDVNQSKAINGDDGGTWNPTLPIVIGGQGLQLPTVGTSLTGGLSTTQGGSIVLGNSDFPSLSPARSRTITFALVQYPGGTPVIAAYGVVLPAQFPLLRPNGLLIPSRYLHHDGGSRLASVTLNYRLVSVPTDIAGGFSTAYAPTILHMDFFPASNPYVPASFAVYGPLQILGSNPVGYWLATTAYAAGAYTAPQFNVGNTPVWSWFKTTGGGTSGGTEPTWNNTIGGTTNDGSIVWTCIGPSGNAYWPDPQSAFSGGTAQQITLTFDQNAGSQLDLAYNYIVSICNPNGKAPVLLHSLQFNFVAISSMTWE